MEAHGLFTGWVQCNISFSREKGTLRGMHYQKPPYSENKLVRCAMGAIVDVIIDLRPESPTYKQHFRSELTAENRRMLYVPKGFAHGFQTLVDCSEVFYQMSEAYHPESATGVRFDDPAFSIKWDPVTRISQRDLRYSDFDG